MAKSNPLEQLRACFPDFMSVLPSTVYLSLSRCRSISFAVFLPRPVGSDRGRLTLTDSRNAWPVRIYRSAAFHGLILAICLFCAFFIRFPLCDSALVGRNAKQNQKQQTGRHLTDSRRHAKRHKAVGNGRHRE